MITETQAQEILTRIAVAALTYYPEKTVGDPGYTLDEDIDWCLDAFMMLPDQYRETMRARIGDVIADPTRHRQAFVDDILALVTATGAA